jgi:pilus assembly protein Flp/PilA
MRMLKQMVCRFRHDESGATAIEYALLAAFIAGVISASVAILGGSLLEKYELVVGLFP